jgi:murein endopeptidase
VIWFFALAAIAGPLGPLADDVRVENADELDVERCDLTYPYALEQLPEHADLMRIYAPERAYGTPAMVRLLVDAAAKVAVAHPEADPLFVGDISTARGGHLPPHRTHDDGRSADLGLYYGDVRQSASGFKVVWNQNLDLATTWTLIEALVSSGKVEHILIDPVHADALAAYVRENELLDEAGVEAIFPGPNAPRLWERRGIVRGAANHREHMHVRLACDTPT